MTNRNESTGMKEKAVSQRGKDVSCVNPPGSRTTNDLLLWKFSQVDVLIAILSADVD